MEIIGKVVELTPIESGTSERGSWAKRTLVILTLDQNPTYIAFSVMQGRFDECKKVFVDDVVLVKFGVSSRRVKDMWFNDIQLWKISKV